MVVQYLEMNQYITDDIYSTSTLANFDTLQKAGFTLIQCLIGEAWIYSCWNLY